MTKKAVFKNSIKGLKAFNTFVMGISMGSKNHTGEAFSATVDCINRTDLKRGIIDVSDTLRRYTHMISMSAEEAHANAREEGDKWIIENTEAIKRFRVPVDVQHWDIWLLDPRFQEYVARFHDAYKNCDVLRNAVKKDIDNFYARKNVALNERGYKLSASFYLEEMAVMSIQFEDNEAAQIYPGKELNCLRVVRAGMVPGVPYINPAELQVLPHQRL